MAAGRPPTQSLTNDDAPDTKPACISIFQGRVAIVHNGTIANSHDLRAELAKQVIGGVGG